MSDFQNDKQSTVMDKLTDIVWHQASVTYEDRANSNAHQSAILWFTGLSGSGKSSIANAVDKMLFELNCKTYVLDGDNIRHGLNADLSFTDKDRIENIRRIGEVSKLFVDAGLIVSSAFISPFIADRAMVRGLVNKSQFIEIFVDTPIKICEQRDPKGLYKKARKGEIKNFTGIDSSYEKPIHPELHIKTATKTIEQSAIQVIQYLKDNGYFHHNDKN